MERVEKKTGRRKEQPSHLFSLSNQKHNTEGAISVVNLVIKVLKIHWGPLTYLFQFHKSGPHALPERPDQYLVKRGAITFLSLGQQEGWGHIQSIGLFSTYHPLSHSALTPLQTACSASPLPESGGLTWGCRQQQLQVAAAPHLGLQVPGRSKMTQKYLPLIYQDAVKWGNCQEKG